MNKKGAELTIGTLVIIVLAIIVLVVLAVGFGAGWTNLWSKITAFFGGGDNVDTQVQACQLACASNSKYAFCNQVRDVKSAGVDNVFKAKDPANNDYAFDASQTLANSKRIKTTCVILEGNYGSLGFEECPEIPCT